MQLLLLWKCLQRYVPAKPFSLAIAFGQTSEAGNDYSNRFRFTVGNQYNTAEITLKSPPVDSFTVQIYRYFAIRDVVKPYPNRISTRVVMS